jgi:hypothetical protein
MEPMTLREAAERTSRSITTLRRYIRGGRLPAEKRPGRFGPEYFVSDADLARAGLETSPRTEEPRELVRRGACSVADPAHASPAGETVPLSLFHELQMKHEQLLVQYGMVRAGGLRIFELRAELEAKQRELDSRDERHARLREELIGEVGHLETRLRESALEREGLGLELATLREKVRSLEMLTRNAVTSDSIERQFGEMMAQARRVERLSAGREVSRAEGEARAQRPPHEDH